MRCAWFVAAVLLGACSAVPRAATPNSLPTGDVVAVAVAADEAVRAAFASADGGPLDGVLVDPALGTLRRQVGALARRGLRREEEIESRRTVHVSGGGPTAEVVLEVRARTRLLTPTEQPAFTSVLRQTRVHLVRRARGWRVDAWSDLRPEEWWRGGAR